MVAAVLDAIPEHGQQVAPPTMPYGSQRWSVAFEQPVAITPTPPNSTEHSSCFSDLVSYAAHSATLPDPFSLMQELQIGGSVASEQQDLQNDACSTQYRGVVNHFALDAASNPTERPGSRVSPYPTGYMAWEVPPTPFHLASVSGLADFFDFESEIERNVLNESNVAGFYSFASGLQSPRQPFFSEPTSSHSHQPILSP